MKLKFGNIIRFNPEGPTLYEPLARILAARYTRGTVPLGALTHNLGRVAEDMERRAQEFDKARRKIIETLDAEDANWREILEKVGAFNTELEALLDTEVEIFGKPFDPAILDQAVGLELSPAEAITLRWLFQQEHNLSLVADAEPQTAAA